MAVGRGWLTSRGDLCPCTFGEGWMGPLKCFRTHYCWMGGWGGFVRIGVGLTNRSSWFPRLWGEMGLRVGEEGGLVERTLPGFLLVFSRSGGGMVGVGKVLSPVTKR
jgi:hypothetical protein